MTLLKVTLYSSLISKVRKILLITLISSFISISLQNAANASNVITSVTIEQNSAKMGDTVYWDVDATCSTGNINQLYLVIIDPIGMNQMINTPGITHNPNDKPVSKGSFRLPLRITAEASPGKYTVQSVNLSCQGTNQQISLSDNLDNLSFTLSNIGLSPAITQPKLENIEMTTPSERKVGDTISIHLIASNTGKINTINLSLRNIETGVTVQSNYLKYDANLSGPSTRRVDTTLDFQVNSDWPAGTWTIATVQIAGYSGIDLSTPWGFDPNPTNSTAVFDRLVLLSNLPGTSSYGRPANGQVVQADLSSIKINVINQNNQQIANPEVSNISMPLTQVKAGESFDLRMDIDGKGANIYQVFGIWADQKTSNIFAVNCFMKDLSSQNFVFKQNMQAATLTCKSSRSALPGLYVMRQLSVYTTTCTGTLFDISSPQGQPCQQQPKQRSTTYSNAYNAPSVETIPQSKNAIHNVLISLPVLTLLPPGPATRPTLDKVSSEENQLVFKYVLDPDYTCNYSTTGGNLKYDGIKGDGSVSVSGLKPMTEVTLTGTCVTADGQSVSFTDKATTSLPKPPSLPLLLESQKTLTTLSARFSSLGDDGNKYEVTVTSGDLTILADTIQITNLRPNQSVTINVKVTDPYGQSTQGDVATLNTNSPPMLKVPIVSLITTNTYNYVFKFNKLPNVKYVLNGTNCSGHISDNNITISKPTGKKLVECKLIATDSYNQFVSTSIFKYKGR